MKSSIVKISFLATSIIFSGCLYKKDTLPKKGNSKLISLYNKGAICLLRDSNSLEVEYYPLATNCASSSLYSWKLNGVDVNNYQDIIKIDSYSLYKVVNSDVATADCAGARVTKKRVKVYNLDSKIYWGDKKIIDNLSTIKSRVCYKSDGNKVIKIDNL